MIDPHITKFRHVLSTFTVVLYSIVLFLILSTILYTDKRIDYICQKEVLFSNLTILLSLLTLSVLLYFICTKTRFVKYVSCLYRKLAIQRDFYVILLLLTALLLLLQIYVDYDILFFAGWDCDTVVSMAFELAFSGTIENTDYLSIYPNNVALTVALSLIIRLFSFFQDYTAIYFALTCVEILLTDVALFLLALTVRRITLRKSVSLVAWFIGVLLIGISPWMIVPYSDGFCLIIPISVLFLYCKRKEFHRFPVICWFGIAFLSLIGFLFKPYTIIVLIAALLVEAFTLLFEHPKRSYLIQALIGLLVGFLLAQGSNRLIQAAINCELDENKAVSYQHYIMMGMNDKWDGIWNNDDFEFSQSFTNPQERVAANKLAIQSRMKEFKLSGYLDFLKRKTLVNFNDGTFAWGFEGGDGGFYMIKLKAPTDTATFLRSFFYNDEAGTRNRYLVLVQQATWVYVLTSMLGLSLTLYKRRRSKELVIMLSVLGMIAFVTIFEARARYLYDFVLIFVVASACGIDHIIQVIKYFSLHRKPL